MSQTMTELQTETGGVVAASYTTLISQTISESDAALFNRLNDDGYISVIDNTLISDFGTRVVRDISIETLSDVPLWKINIMAYLRRRVDYFKKCLMYIDATYNPVENYAGTETETVTNVYDDDVTSTSSGTKTKTLDYDSRTDTDTRGDVTEEFTRGDMRTTTKNAPFENTNFYNAEQQIQSMTDGDGDATKDISKVSQDTPDTHTIGGHTDTITETPFTDTTTRNARTDVMTRNFTRAGNIGVLAPGELMSKDSEFWSSFHWLLDTAHDIANMITTGVTYL